MLLYEIQHFETDADERWKRLVTQAMVREYSTLTSTELENRHYERQYPLSESSKVIKIISHFIYIRSNARFETISIHL